MVSEALALFPELLSPKDEVRTGLLPLQKLLKAIELGYIRGLREITAKQIQPSSLDLRLGSVGYHVAASFLPGASSSIAAKLTDLVVKKVDLSVPALLTKGNVYVVPLLEELNLPNHLWGKANPKSTTGRLDVFTRLLCDYGDEFETVPNGFKGRLYAEIAPRTFDVIVQEGVTLNQIRLIKGKPAPSASSLLELHRNQGLVYSEEAIADATISKKSLWLSLDLEGASKSDIVGFKARKDAPPVDFSLIAHYDPTAYWFAIRAPERSRIILEADEFYILASKERIRVPAEYAAEMVPFDPSVGEFRIHYAGFFDPGFGYRTDDFRGTHAVLEVRSHGIPFLVEDGQRIGRLVFEQMLSAPTKLYGSEMGSSYQFQRLALSKQFKPWPSDL